MVAKKISEFTENYGDSYFLFEDENNEVNFKVSRINSNPAIKLDTNGGLTPASAIGLNSLAIGFNSVSTSNDSVQIGSGNNTVANSIQFLGNNFVNQYTLKSKTVTSNPIFLTQEGSVSVNTTSNTFWVSDGNSWYIVGKNPYINITPSATNNSLPSGSNILSISIGGKSEAISDNSIAIGVDTDTGGDYAIATGFKSKATGIKSIAIGQPQITTLAETLASGLNTISIGNHVQTTGVEAIGIGSRLTSTNNESIAIGNLAFASGLRNICIGSSNNGSTLSPSDIICLGNLARSNQESGMSLGGSKTVNYGTSTISVGATSVGAESTCSGGNVAIGYASRSTGSLSVAPGNVAIGYAAASNATSNSIAIGYNSLTSTNNCISFGSNTGFNTNGVSSFGTDVWNPVTQVLVKTQVNSLTPTLVTPNDGTISQFSGANGFLYVRVGGVWKQTAPFVP